MYTNGHGVLYSNLRWRYSPWWTWASTNKLRQPALGTDDDVRSESQMSSHLNFGIICDICAQLCNAKANSKCHEHDRKNQKGKRRHKCNVLADPKNKLQREG